MNMCTPSHNFLSYACGSERIAQHYYINTPETRVGAAVSYSSFQIKDVIKDIQLKRVLNIFQQLL
jgi:hypothetical protein